MSIRIGDRYQLISVIGAGAMGQVYQARDQLTGRVIALKRFVMPQRPPPDPLASPESEPAEVLLALAHEFRVLASLRHPNIISVLDYGFDSERQPFFTMELLPQPQTILEAGRGQPLGRQIDLLVQLLQALTYLHRRGILHHDVKPENVLVSGGQVRVLDFGLSVLFDQPRVSDSFGTILYLAPEVLDGEAYTPTADLYAVGVIACELLAGRHPYAAADFESFLDRLSSGQPDLPMIADAPDLTLVLRRLLTRDTAIRYSSADQVVAALYAAIGHTPSPEHQGLRESFLQAAAFVGREVELARLREALAQAMQGHGSLWLIGGESGVGKSRLLDELRSEALVVGALVLQGNAEEGASRTYQIWQEPLRRLALTPDLDDRSIGVLKILLPDLTTILGRPIADAPTLEREAVRQLLVKVTASLIQSQRQPVVILLDDLQWAGESLDFLRDLWRQLDGSGLLVIGTYRDDERPMLPAHLPGAHILKLERLGLETIATLSSAMLGESGRRPDIVAWLAQETEGNAFFMVEVVRALAEESGGLSAIGQATLPARVLVGGMHQLIRRRLLQVPHAARTLLRHAAVIGRQIDRAVLEALLAQWPEIAPSGLDVWLRSCAEVAVLEVVGDAWRFTHDKLREGLLADLHSSERPTLHRRAALAIEAVYGSEPTRSVYAETLAEHWRQADEPAHEVSYLALAADRCVHFTADYQRGKALAERGLALTTRLQPPEAFAHHHAELRCQLGNALMYLGEHATAHQHFSDALELALSAGDESGAAVILNSLAEIAYRQSDPVQLEQLAHRSRDLALRCGNRKAEARALNLLAIAYATRNDYATAETYNLESKAIYEAMGDRWGVAVVLHDLGMDAPRAGDYQKAYAYLRSALEIFTSTGDQAGIVLAHINLSIIYATQGDDTQAAQHLAEASLVSAVLGDPWLEQSTQAPRANQANSAGAYAAAAAAAGQGIAACDAIGERFGKITLLHQLSAAQISLGASAAAEQRLGEALALTDEIEAPELAGQILMELGALRLEQARLDEAADLLHEGLKRLRATADPLLLSCCLRRLAELALARGKPATAQPYLEEAIGLSRRLGLRPELTLSLCVEARRLAQHPASPAAALRVAAELARAIGRAPLQLEVILTAAELGAPIAPPPTLAALVLQHPCAGAAQRRRAATLGGDTPGDLAAPDIGQALALLASPP